mmetsp:Transcript_38731/g.64353  ORF Transcript_38731/g.64353 Transcript_38731/m.64353 type:complete len:265 (-) Transcript_38731:1410-2204(-)
MAKIRAQLDHLHPHPFCVRSREHQPGLFHHGDPFCVHLIAMALPLYDLRQTTIQLRGHRAALEDDLPGPNDHAVLTVLEEVRDAINLWHVVQDVGLLPFRIELLGRAAVQAQLVLAEAHDCHLHPQGHPQERDLMVPRPVGCRRLALHPAVPEAPRHKDAVGARQFVDRRPVREAVLGLLQIRRVHPQHLELAVGLDGGVVQRLQCGLVRVTFVFGDNCDDHLLPYFVLAAGQALPILKGKQTSVRSGVFLGHLREVVKTQICS